jgi:hypothetical protein
MLVETSRKLHFSQQNSFILVIVARILRNRTGIEQELILETDSDKAISSDSESELDEDTVETDNNNMSGSQANIWSRPQHPWNSGGVHPFIGVLSGLKIQEAPHENEDSSPIAIFILFFMDVIQLLVAENNKYYNHYLDTIGNDDGCY